MSVYSMKKKGWRYDFTLTGVRHTEAGFRTKQEARLAEAKKRDELDRPAPTLTGEKSPDDRHGLLGTGHHIQA